MAWIEDFTLTCPGCNRREAFDWVFGVPLTTEGRAKSKGYVSVRNARGWQVKETSSQYIVSCPECGGDVTRQSLTP